MSLILEALKRSEKERRQQAEAVTDTLYIDRSPPRKPIWPMLIVVLLLVNIILFSAIFLQVGGESGDTTAAPTASIPPGTDPVDPAPPSVPLATKPEAARIASRILRPLNQELGGTRLRPEPNRHQPAAKPADSGEAPPPSAKKPDSATGYPAVIETAPGTRTVVAMDQKTAAALEQYEINTIVYSDTPARRFALVDMKKLHEGDTLPGSGYRIDEITRRGLMIETDRGLVLFDGR